MILTTTTKKLGAIHDVVKAAPNVVYESDIVYEKK